MEKGTKEKDLKKLDLPLAVERQSSYREKIELICAGIKKYS